MNANTSAKGSRTQNHFHSRAIQCAFAIGFLAKIALQLETGAASSFHYDVLAGTGKLDTRGRALTAVDRYVSINDLGTVAFVGKIQGDDGRLRQNIYAVNTVSGAILPLMNAVFELPESGDNPTQAFGPVQINNQNRVLSRRRTTAIVQVGFPFGEIIPMPLTYIEAWEAGRTLPVCRTFPSDCDLPRQVIMGDAGIGSAWSLLFFLNPITANILPTPFVPLAAFDGVFSESTINDHGEVVFSALEGTDRYLVTPAAPGAGFEWLVAGAPGDPRRVRMANNQTFVFRSGSASPHNIRVLHYPDFGFVQDVAGAANGFVNSTIGRTPTISDDGRVVVFYGDLTTGATTVGVTPGPGVFASIRNGASWTLRRIAGLSGNGSLDPGEGWVDANNNGIVDLGEDNGPFSGFYPDEAFGAANSGAVVFLAIGAAGKGLYSSRIDLVDAALPVDPPLAVIRQGDTVEGTAGSIQDIAIHDPVNNELIPDIAFWASTSSDSMILLATPCQGTECAAAIAAANGKINVTDGPQCLNFPTTAQGHDWSMDISYVDGGIVVENVKLRNRLMARKISVPYFVLSTSLMAANGTPPARGQLKVASNPGVQLHSQLVQPPQVSVDGDKLVIEGVFYISNLPNNSQSCIQVVQRYEFRNLLSSAPFEPSGELLGAD